jgi:PDZ domain
MLRLVAALLVLSVTGGSLGVKVSELGPEQRAASAIYNLQGVVVGEIVAGGAASRSGLRVNDIITAVGGDAVTSVQGLLSILARHDAGEAVVVNVVRPGNSLPYPKLSLRVKLGAAPSGPDNQQPVNPVTQVTPGRRVVPPRGFHAIDAVGAVSVTAKQKGQCRALVPADWEIVGTRDAGDAVDIMSGDKRSYAGWSIHGVNPQMRQYYGDLYADPQTSSRYIVGLVGQSLGDAGPYSFTGQPIQLGAGFVAQELASQAHKALIVYRVYPAPPMSPQGSYIISLRIAVAPRSAGDRELHTATGVAVGVQCAVKFIPPKQGEISISSRDDVFDRRRHSETNELSSYNVQLGTQYAHSPSTGATYLMDRAAEWNDHGPDGPGYYRSVGNSYEKLVPGIQ